MPSRRPSGIEDRPAANLGTGSICAVNLVGVTTDLPVSDLGRAVTFYAMLFDRPPNLLPPGGPAEWIMHRDPEIAVRLVAAAPPRPGGARIGLGVADVDAERDRLAGQVNQPLRVTRKPGVIATLELRDPDANLVVVWQDLLRP
jgi:predicted enzyme related to lactoylglutathione lyase